MSYTFQVGANRATTGPYSALLAGETGLGVGVILPALPGGFQIDSIAIRQDIFLGVTYDRITILSGSMDPAGVVALCNAIPAAFATRTAQAAPDPRNYLLTLAETIAGGLTVRLDTVLAVTDTRAVLPFSPRPGAGAVIPAGETGVVLLTPTYASDLTPPATVPFCSLTVYGAPLPAGAGGPLADAGGAGPARFHNTQRPPTL